MAKAPPKPRRQRDKQVTLRVSEAEYKAFREKADDVAIDLTTWIRLTCRRAVGLETP